jgi:hypothetical protein
MYQKDLHWTIAPALNIAQVEHLTLSAAELDYDNSFSYTVVYKRNMMHD